MRFAAYLRCSTDRQADVSIPAQRESITAWAKAHDYTISEWFIDEGSSGKNLKRPVLEAAILAAENRCDGLVILKLDRLTRHVKDFCSLVERFEGSGKGLVSVRDSLDTTSPAGRLVATIMAGFAQYERERISEATKTALAKRRAAGVRLGRPTVDYPPPVVELAVRLVESGVGQVEAARRVSDTGYPCDRYKLARIVSRAT
jgi:DNA invertase Pin-like site-specific DNA recombinase